MPKRYGQNRDIQHDHERKRAFGLQPKDKWPKEGMKPIVINLGYYGDVTHKVLSVDNPLNGTARRGRRAVACCPLCAKWVCAGHLGQHIDSHKS